MNPAAQSERFVNTGSPIRYSSLSQHSTEFFPPLEFLLFASQVSLQDLELAALNRSSNLFKVLQHEVNKWVEQVAIAMLVRWVMENREALQAYAEAKGPMLPFVD